MLFSFGIDENHIKWIVVIATVIYTKNNFFQFFWEGRIPWKKKECTENLLPLYTLTFKGSW